MSENNEAKVAAWKALTAVSSDVIPVLVTGMICLLVGWIFYLGFTTPRDFICDSVNLRIMSLPGERTQVVCAWRGKSE